MAAFLVADRRVEHQPIAPFEVADCTLSAFDDVLGVQRERSRLIDFVVTSFENEHAERGDLRVARWVSTVRGRLLAQSAAERAAPDALDCVDAVLAPVGV